MHGSRTRRFADSLCLSDADLGGVCVNRLYSFCRSVALLPPSGVVPLSSSLFLRVNTAVKLVSGWMFRSVQYVTWNKVMVTRQAEMQR